MIYLDSNNAGIPDNCLFYPVDLVIFKAVPNCQGKGIDIQPLAIIPLVQGSPVNPIQPDYLGAHKNVLL